MDSQHAGAPEIPANPLPPRVESIGIGVQKAATSWLFRCLIQHPDLRGSTLDRGDKELNFFNRYHEYGYDWYESHFESGASGNMEFSVLYFHDRNVPERIKAYNPNARLLLCLRNPVERALSQYTHEIRSGRLKAEEGDFLAAMERNPSYVYQGLYGKHLERWLKHFSLEQLFVIDYEDIRNRPSDTLRRAFAFLGVSPDFRPSLTNQAVNRAVVRRSGPFFSVVGWAATGGKKLLGRRLTKTWRSHPVLQAVQRKRYVEVKRPRLEAGSPQRERVAGLFRSDLLWLSELLGKDYSHWR